MQKSIREGFGLTVTEALWKARPTIAGNVGGIPLQIKDGETGYLVSSPEECAQRCLEILGRPRAGQAARARRQGARARATSCPRACCATGCALFSDLDLASESRRRAPAVDGG